MSLKAVRNLLILSFVATALVSCSNEEEMTLEEAQSLKAENQQGLLAGTVKKPGGVENFAIGKSGGIWTGTETNDPKTFNLVTADGEQAASNLLTGLLPGYLADYNPYTRTWEPHVASFEIFPDESADTMDVKFTLRNDLYWSFYKTDEKIQITADDVVFWYNEIYGNDELQMSAYAQQFLTMADGSEAKITIEKIDKFSFAFHFPRIIANPILSCNMEFGPKFIYEPLLKKYGPLGMKDQLTVDMDVTRLPSGGPDFLVEYTPGVRLVYEANQDYWEKDEEGQRIPYIEKSIEKIVPDTNTSYLLFRNGETDAYGVRPENLDELLKISEANFTVYDGGAGLGSSFFSFNQNPDTIPEPMLSWFSQKKFRQAMSRLTNRPRMIKQVYRGLGRPALHHFAVANPYYDEGIQNIYTYNPEEAIRLLATIGIKQDNNGTMRDAGGNAIEFDITTNASSNTAIDIISIFADECGKVGIKVNVKPLDFQKIVEMLMGSYDWQSLLMGFSGSNYWPTSGSNIWPSYGNLHLWNPLQKEPATDWEARLDYLYNEGSFTQDPIKAKTIWDEFQSIMVEELPLYYLVYPESFFAIRNRWDNVFYDTLGGINGDRLFLKAVE